MVLCESCFGFNVSWAYVGSPWDSPVGSKTCCGPSGAHSFEKSMLGKNEASRRDLGTCGADLGAQRAPKRSPRGSQDEAKNEKKNEVNLGRVSVCLGRVKGKRREVVTRPLGE